jgi:hypothetical protein
MPSESDTAKGFTIMETREECVDKQVSSMTMQAVSEQRLSQNSHVKSPAKSSDANPKDSKKHRVGDRKKHEETPEKIQPPSPPVPDDAIPFERALRLLQEAKVPGLMSRTPLRKAFLSKKLPGYIKGKRSIYLARGPLFELIGSVPVGAALTIDQALVCHYEASEFNTPISAVTSGIALNLEKARQVFNDWIATRDDPRVAARIAAKKQADTSETSKTKPSIVSACHSCNRTLEQAHKDDEAINILATGHKETPTMSETLALSGFQDKKCTGCGKWFPSAPVTDMRAALETSKKT